MNSKLSKALRKSLRELSGVNHPERVVEYEVSSAIGGTRICKQTTPRGLYSRTKSKLAAARERSRGSTVLRTRSKARRRESGRPAWGHSVLPKSVEGNSTSIGIGSEKVLMEGVGIGAQRKAALRRCIDKTLAG